jgi:pSer/pThr/pTyr-binding forkhead associated (FHA) protein
VPAPEPVVAPEPDPPVQLSPTQLQQVVGRLFHLQGNQEVELPQNLSVIHIGKPNDRIPPDIDVAGFSNSEIVSRIHADIRVEGDAYYIEDVGSSNGTYINNLPLLPGNRHRLRPGDRISLGKGDLVTFLFQLS